MLKSSLPRFVPALLFSTLGVVACVGDTPATPATGADGGTDAATTDTGAPPPVDASCACVDNGASLQCGSTKTACDYGCADAAGPTPAHCRLFDPTGPVDPTDLSVQGLKPYSGMNLKFNTDTGRITSDDGVTELRPANADPTKEEVSPNGIGFRRVDGEIGIFQFDTLTIDAADLFHVNGATGSLALGLVATKTITIKGKLDLGCPSSHTLYYFTSAGSFAGGSAGTDGLGAGGGKHGLVAQTYAISGGGGGGHGALGGTGGIGRLDKNTGGDTAGGVGGTSYDDTGAPRGGSGGGANGATTLGTTAAGGGAGGGAVQLVAGKEIIIGSGTATANPANAREGINVGGCGGGAALGSGAGGGAGGSIFLEAPTVTGKANAGLGVNGGAGGGGASDTPVDGLITLSPAVAAAANACFGPGGNGSAGDSVGGSSGSAGSTICASGYANRLHGGGGGGAEGYVRIRTLDGTFTPDASFVVSASATQPSGTPLFTHGKITLR